MLAQTFFEVNPIFLLKCPLIAAGYMTKLSDQSIFFIVSCRHFIWMLLHIGYLKFFLVLGSWISSQFSNMASATGWFVRSWNQASVPRGNKIICRYTCIHQNTCANAASRDGILRKRQGFSFQMLTHHSNKGQTNPKIELWTFTNHNWTPDLDVLIWT